MTTRKRSDLPVVHDVDQAELAWLLARDQDPGAPAPSPELAAEYVELEALLGSLSPGPIDDSWHHAVVRAAATAAAAAQPWWRTAGLRWVPGGVAVAAAVVWMLLPDPPDPRVLEVAVHHLGTTRGSPDEAVVGDHLVVTARPHEVGDLRVYRSDGTLVARCPDGPGCGRPSQGAQTIEIMLSTPLQYRVILVDGASRASLDGGMDGYLDAARATHARVTLHPPIDVH